MTTLVSLNFSQKSRENLTTPTSITLFPDLTCNTINQTIPPPPSWYPIVTQFDEEGSSVMDIQYLVNKKTKNKNKNETLMFNIY